jgi:hypothetical protein
MELKISHLTFDDARLYLVDSGKGDSSGMQAPGLKAWLLDLGVLDSTVDLVLDMGPNETMSVKVAGKAA